MNVKAKNVDGDSIKFETTPVDSVYRFKLYKHSEASAWRRVWFVVSVVPRYLISGSVEVP